jgi:predicted polyphosphate/ATP-dependent NAD kinase
MHAVARIGFLINPIAGMGGRVGLKGTDEVVDQARRLGAEPVARLRAAEALRELHRRLAKGTAPHWLTCAGEMGAAALQAAGFDDIEVVHEPGEGTSRDDTQAAVRKFLAGGADLILFCGGDGTARDICDVTEEVVPILGIPSGVKMFSGVFGVSPAHTAEIVVAFLQGKLTTATVEVLDLDEERYRRGEWAVKFYYSAITPFEPTYTQSAKMMIAAESEADAKDEIARNVVDEIEAAPDTLFLLGAGSTVKAIGDWLGIDKTLLGIDAVAGGKLVEKDVNESRILALLDRYASCRLILSPIGAQGFVLGRGNLQLSPEVIRRIGRQNLTVVATPAKLAQTPVLHVDTGSRDLDRELTQGGYLPVVTGYRLRRFTKVAA